MAIKALFPAGQHEATTDSLYQWDYGQVLEIEATDLGSEAVEVHFACPNMTEAIIRPCNLTSGVGNVTIPDDCLEQTATVTAWIYEIVGTQGRTRKIIKIPVIPRTRPSVGHDIPTEICDRYTELITEVNEAVDALENGNVVVKKATEATKADSATSAGNASTANFAIGADRANSAEVLTPLALLTDNVDGTIYTIDYTGIYVVVFHTTNTIASAVIAISNLNADAYGTDTTIGQPVYDGMFKELAVYLNGDKLQIDAVYQIAKI